MTTEVTVIKQEYVENSTQVSVKDRKVGSYVSKHTWET